MAGPQRVELVGGTYNEPNTNLTCIETTIRNAVYGIGFQRHVIGAAPATVWQLDVFGHDPQFPQVVSGTGLTSSAFARGPYHQWGPMLTSWNIREHRKPFAPTQFPTEFEWVAPSGDGVLTHYMAAHYAAGFSLDAAQSPQTAAAELYDLFTELRQVAATRNVMIPMGSDFTPPMRWVTELRAAWHRRYQKVRLRCGLPRDFFAAVRADLAAAAVRPTPQTRDMNPVYTGKDVTAIDTKQAHRMVETLLLDAEKWARCSRAAWSTVAARSTSICSPAGGKPTTWPQPSTTRPASIWPGTSTPAAKALPSSCSTRWRTRARTPSACTSTSPVPAASHSPTSAEPPCRTSPRP